MQILQSNSSESQMVATFTYSAPNLTTILSGVADPLFVLQKEGYPFTFQARDQTEFSTANFETVWDLLLSNPDRFVKL
jgi:hypothetical protein